MVTIATKHSWQCHLCQKMVFFITYENTQRLFRYSPEDNLVRLWPFLPTAMCIVWVTTIAEQIDFNQSTLTYRLVDPLKPNFYTLLTAISHKCVKSTVFMWRSSWWFLACSNLMGSYNKLSDKKTLKLHKSHYICFVDRLGLLKYNFQDIFNR